MMDKIYCVQRKLPMKIMAIDLGDVRTGVAFSDLTGMIAGRAYTITEYNRDKLLARLCTELAAEQPDEVVLGLPLNMNGTEGERAAKSRAFASQLEEKWGKPIVLWDERGTSVTANRILSDAGKKRGRQRAQVDAVAASVILQAYLDYRNRTR